MMFVLDDELRSLGDCAGVTTAASPQLTQLLSLLSFWETILCLIGCSSSSIVPECCLFFKGAPLRPLIFPCGISGKSIGGCLEEGQLHIIMSSLTMSGDSSCWSMILTMRWVEREDESLDGCCGFSQALGDDMKKILSMQHPNRERCAGSVWRRYWI